MNRFIVCAILGIAVSSELRAAEYLIRVETVGYEDVPVTVEVPEERTFTRIEAIAGLNRKFSRTVTTGDETLVLTGRLKPTQDGGLSLEIKYSHLVDTGITVPADDGTERPIIDESTCECTVSITLDREVVLGGVEEKQETRNGGQKIRTKSKRIHVVTVTRRKPDEA